MDTLLNQLRELLKHYTVAANVAFASQRHEDMKRGTELLKQINAARLSLAINAEMREIFYKQVNIPAAPNSVTTQNIWVGQNDIRYTIKRGIAALNSNVNISLDNQGARYKEITRNPTRWQQLFADIQRAAPRGQQTLLDLPEVLQFDVNQALNIGITGQDAVGWLFLHGANIKQDIENSSINDIRREFLTDAGQTLYLPETQILPIFFSFASNAAGTLATSPNGDTNIFSTKSDRSVLITHVSSTSPLCRIDKLTDEARNQTLVERVEMAGVAADASNPFTTWYELPEPHLLRRGNRLKGVFLNGSDITGTTIAANVVETLSFKGITL